MALPLRSHDQNKNCQKYLHEPTAIFSIPAVTPLFFLMIWVVLSIGSEADAAVVQEQLRKAYKWAENNAMVFNLSKFDQLEYLSHSHLDFQVELEIGDGSVIRN